MGVSIISTSKGMMTDKNARKENIGGEVLCNIW
jgi:small subunit ribosomal protein S8